MNFDLDRIRERLSTLDAVPLLALLGILAGLSSGLIIILFRMVIELTLGLFLPDHSENFEGLSPLLQGALPLTCGGLLATVA